MDSGVRTSAVGIGRGLVGLVPHDVQPIRPSKPKGPMDLEQALEKIVELAREELHIVRKRAEEKTPARDHGKDFHEAQNAADRLDHYAHQLHRLHDAEYQHGWRDVSAGDRE